MITPKPQGNVHAAGRLTQANKQSDSMTVHIAVSVGVIIMLLSLQVPYSFKCTVFVSFFFFKESSFSLFWRVGRGGIISFMTHFSYPINDPAVYLTDELQVFQLRLKHDIPLNEQQLQKWRLGGVGPQVFYLSILSLMEPTSLLTSSANLVTFCMICLVFFHSRWACPTVS